LKMMVSLLRANRFPLLLWWGPQYAQLYNDSYRPVLGTKHPTLSRSKIYPHAFLAAPRVLGRTLMNLLRVASGLSRFSVKHWLADRYSLAA
jgi:hypothetical protein